MGQIHLIEVSGLVRGKPYQPGEPIPRAWCLINNLALDILTKNNPIYSYVGTKDGSDALRCLEGEVVWKRTTILQMGLRGGILAQLGFFLSYSESRYHSLLVSKMRLLICDWICGLLQRRGMALIYANQTHCPSTHRCRDCWVSCHLLVKHFRVFKDKPVYTYKILLI